ncbi:MAG: MBL fold metallo-hydrolase [Candidatus Thorarchaeota archaeon]|jgi:cyclase
MVLTRLIDGIYTSTDGTNGGNHGAIVHEDEIVMIDSGMIHQKSLETKRSLEKDVGLPIKTLIYTHSHGDHVFGAQAFEPVNIIASLPMQERFEENFKSDWKRESLLKRYFEIREERPELWNAVQTLSIRVPKITFRDKLSIGNNDEITVKLLGGHTSGSSIIIAHAEKTIFVGDLIFSGQFPYGGDPTCNPDDWIKALEEVREIDYDTIIPGHGPICGINELEEYTHALRDLRDAVKNAVSFGTTKEQLIEQGQIPKLLQSGIERFGASTLDHWIGFYKKGV